MKMQDALFGAILSFCYLFLLAVTLIGSMVTSGETEWRYEIFSYGMIYFPLNFLLDMLRGADAALFSEPVMIMFALLNAAGIFLLGWWMQYIYRKVKSF